jgi:hypothetical protein
MSLDCNERIHQIQYALQNLPEYNNIYAIRINSTTKVPSPTEDSNESLQCDANFTYNSVETGYANTSTRRVTFSADPDLSGDYVVTAVSVRNPQNDAIVPQRESDILDYYRSLRGYNKNWISYAWKEAIQTNALYNPPRPKWTDVIFESNVNIYNTNFGATREYIKQNINNFTIINELYRTRIAPLPADPIPPQESAVLVSYTASDPLQDARDAEQGAADNNTDSIAGAQITYNDFLPPGSVNFDPPVPGDSYETVLIKLNKAFDEASANQSASINAAGGYSGSIPSQYDRRLIGRVARNFPVPGPIIPPTPPPTNAAKYAPYTFTERQRHLIEYTPVNASDREILKANFCKSLGYLSGDSGKTECDKADCCAPLPNQPKYSGELEEAFTSASGSNARRKCTGRAPSLLRRTTTVSVPSAPLNIETSQRLYTHRMTHPVENCRPAQPAQPTVTVGQIYDAVRPALVQQIRKSLEGDKMFSLRCPGSCFNN